MTVSGVDVGVHEAAEPTPVVVRRRRRVPTPQRMLFFLIFQRTLTRGITAGAVK